MGKTRIILLDGFREDYLKHAPYLSSLTRTNQWGLLKIPPGHWGMIETLFKGKSSVLSFFKRSEKGSLKWLRYFRLFDVGGRIFRLPFVLMICFIRSLKGLPFVNFSQIPFSKIHLFDFAVSSRIYDNNKIILKYYGSIDKFAHKYGTEDLRLVREIKRIDSLISKEKFDILVSDHGMVDVREHIQVPIIEQCFIDSDMARYWGEQKELEKIRKRLPLNKGRILEWEEKEFGELIFITNPGVLIFPNFWNKKPIKAMHGHLPEMDRKLQAIYILNRSGKRRDIDVSELHRLLKDEKRI